MGKAEPMHEKSLAQMGGASFPVLSAPDAGVPDASPCLVMLGQNVL